MAQAQKLQAKGGLYASLAALQFSAVQEPTLWAMGVAHAPKPSGTGA